MKIKFRRIVSILTAAAALTAATPFGGAGCLAADSGIAELPELTELIESAGNDNEDYQVYEAADDFGLYKAIISYDGEKVSVTTNDENIKTAQLLVAAYSEDILENVEIVDLKFSEKEAEKALNVKEGAVLYLWDSINEMTPLSEKYTYNSQQETDTGRETYNFDYGWEFAKGVGKNNSGSDIAEEEVTVIAESEEPWTESYQIDDRWESVSLPHTYNDTDTFNNFTESGHNGERSMYTGTAWYKKAFTVPEKFDGKRLYLEFEAARQAATLYINGVKLEGVCENGFIPFGYDITDYDYLLSK